MKRIILFAALAASLLVPGMAGAQQTYPTPASGVRVPGTVPLQCDASGVNCAFIASANPVPVSVISGGGSVPTGAAGTPATDVVTVQGITGGTPLIVGGNVAHDAVDSGNPIKVGGYAANSTHPTNVAVGDRVNAWFGLNGVHMVGAAQVTGTDTLSNFNMGVLPSPSGGGGNLVLLTHGTLFDGTQFLRARGDANGMVIQKGLAATRWSYSNGTGGILSNTTTAVTIKAAIASVKAAIDSCQISTTAFGTAVPLAIREGAGGTIRWAAQVPTGGWLQPITIVFDSPLVAAANTLWEVVTTTANTSGTVWVNCQGHTEV